MVFRDFVRFSFFFILLQQEKFTEPRYLCILSRNVLENLSLRGNTVILEHIYIYIYIYIYILGVKKVWTRSNISIRKSFTRKCFRQKLYSFEGNITWYHWFDLEKSPEGHVKVNSNFLNGTPYILLHILVACLKSFPLLYIFVFFH